MQVDLPPETWRALHAVIVENVMPRYRALAELERALNEAHKPPAEEPTE